MKKINKELDDKLKNLPVEDLIYFINTFTSDEAKRCRLYLSAILLRSEKGDK